MGPMCFAATAQLGMRIAFQSAHWIARRTGRLRRLSKVSQLVATLAPAEPHFQFFLKLSFRASTPGR